MIAFRSLTLPLFTLVAVLAGCSAETGTAAGTESVDEVSSSISTEQAGKASGSDGADRAARKGRRPHGPTRGAHGGPDFLVRAALRAPIDLTAEQKATIEGLVKASSPRERSVDPARASKLAAAIRNNSVEVAPQPKADESGREARIAASAKALATLHDTLTAEQRATLVDSIKERAAKHGQERAAKRGERGERHVRGPGGHGGAPMKLLAHLDLTQEQKDAIKSKLEAARPAKPNEEQRAAMKAKATSMRAEMTARLDSFKGDTFDATAFVTPPKDLAAATAGGRMNRTSELAAITSVLTPAQRETLAARIEESPAKPDARARGALNAPRTAR